MFSTVVSASIYGVESRCVHVEADVSEGLPVFSMVGYLSAQVKEAQERVRTALKNSGFLLRPKRITVNLAPADLRKSGSGFDLPIALAIAAGYGIVPAKALEGLIVVGELSLNGEVNGIPGVLPMMADAAEKGYKKCLLPAANIREAAVIDDIDVIGVRTLADAIAWLRGEKKIRCDKKAWERPQTTGARESLDFSQIWGQEAVKRAAEVSAAGLHNLLMIGPPGTGKSMIAKRLPAILPPMSRREQLEVSSIYSVMGLLPECGDLLRERPVRMPHHTATAKSLAGGGRNPRPGEISLAHNGILFLDEFPEFQRAALEILRQPLEDGYICINRMGNTYRFPANFMLVAAMNPCPCGYYPAPEKCSCSVNEVRKYLNKISSPLLERIDITIEAGPVVYGKLRGKTRPESSEEIRKRVMKAHEIQRDRYRGTSYRFNSDLEGNGIQKYCGLGKEESALMENAFDRLGLSVRSCHKVLKVARTVADLDGSGEIETKHLQEALCYRNMNKKYWIGR